MSAPVMILAFAFDRTGVGEGYLRALAAEKHALEAALRPAERAGRCKVVPVPDATVDGLARVFDLYNDEIVVFHFGGHAGPEWLQLNAPDGSMVDALGEGVALRLGELSALRLVCLNGCATAAQRAAIERACPGAAVVTTERAVRDEVARAFAEQLFRALGEGATVASAFARSEARVRQGYERPDDVRMLRPHGMAERSEAWPWRLDGPPAAREWCLPGAVERATSPPKVSTHRLPTCGPHLFGREAELAMLDAAWRDGQTHVVEVVARGGAGKTALARQWLNRMQARGFEGARRVFAWSFYAQSGEECQTSADLFIDQMLRWLGDSSPTGIDSWQKGERLAEMVRRERTLVILDGVEPLQSASGPRWGSIEDPALRVFVELLADGMDGLCVLTSRLPVRDLDDRTGGAVLRCELDRLPVEAGVAFLGALGVRGEPESLREAVVSCRGHALTLRLLGSYVATVEAGDIRRMVAIEALGDADDGGGQARSIMRAYETWLPAVDRAVLRVVSLFDRAADPAAIEAVMAPPAIEGLSEGVDVSRVAWRLAVSHLVELGLIEQQADGGLDVHPLVREHFAAQLRTEKPDTWRSAHLRLYTYFAGKAPFRPRSLDDMEPLFRAVMHGCAAGRHREVLAEVYRRRIQRHGRYYETNTLGAFAASVATLGHFFAERWSVPHPAIEAHEAAEVLSLVGYNLRALGRLDEAVGPTAQGLERTLACGDLYRAAGSAANLSELLLLIGRLHEASQRAREAVAYADGCGDGGFARKNARAVLGDVLHQRGALREALSVFAEAEAIDADWTPVLDGIHGFRYSDLLLSLGENEEVRRRAQHNLEMLPLDRRPLLSALAHLLLGRVTLAASVDPSSEAFERARAYLDVAVDAFRASGRRDHLPRGLLARAALHHRAGAFAAARRDLDEVRGLACSREMRLHAVDCELETARLCLAEGDVAGACVGYERARASVAQMGYHRRDGAVAELGDALERIAGGRVGDGDRPRSSQ